MKSIKLYLFTLFFVTNLSLFGQGNFIDGVIATIGSEIILKSDLEGLVLEQKAQGMETFDNPYCIALKFLLEQNVMYGVALQDSTISVSATDIARQLNGRMDFFVQQLGSEANVEKYFKKSISEIKDEMRETIKKQLYMQYLQGNLSKDIKTTPSEVNTFYENLDSLPTVNTKVRIRQIVAKPHQDITQEEKVRNTLNGLKKRVESGESSFSVLATLYSEDPGSSNKGGDIGWQGKAQLQAPYASAAMTLRKGQISNVVRTEVGYHLILLVDRKGNQIHTKHILMRPKIDQEAVEEALGRLDTIRQSIIDEKYSFEEAAFKYTNDKTGRYNGGLIVNETDRSSLISLEQISDDIANVVEKLKEGELSKPFISFDENRNTVAKIVQVVEYIERHPLSLERDYDQVSDMALGKKRQEAMEKWLEEQVATIYINIDKEYQSCDLGAFGKQK